MNRAAFKLFCLDGDGHTTAKGERIRDCRMHRVSILSLSTFIVVLVCYASGTVLKLCKTASTTAFVAPIFGISGKNSLS